MRFSYGFNRPTRWSIDFLTHDFALILYGFHMVLIVPLVGLSTLGLVFLWFSYAVVMFSYGFNRPPSLVYLLSG